MASVGLKLLVDRKKNTVVFAECEKDFVDILFSFLTLPLGTIVRLLGKKSSLGCLDKLYESAENLGTKYYETEACKTMILQPRSTAERICEDLKVRADGLQQGRRYRCPSFDCFTKTNRLYSSIRGARCPCGRAMDLLFVWDPTVNDAKDGVFLKGEAAYIVSDDLHVAPATVTAARCLLQMKGFKDAKALEMQAVDVHRHEVLGLLKGLLLSKTPLTDVFLPKLQVLVKRDKKEAKLTKPAQVKPESEIEAAYHEKTISVKLLHNKITKEVIYAEGGNDFVDAVLSFLTVPLGSVVKLLNKHSSIGCVDNLYRSVEVLDADSNFIKSKDCKNMLLSPKLYSHFDCSNQMIKIETKLSAKYTVQGCETCWINARHAKCTHNIDQVSITEINPKLQNPGTKNGGGFARKSERFIVSNEMGITALSPISAIDVIKHCNAPLENLVEKEVPFGEAEVLNILTACLTSSNALGGIFSPKKSRKLMQSSYTNYKCLLKMPQ